MTSWLTPIPPEPALRDALAEVHELAAWSDWVDVEAGRHGAPREPGVYLLREPFSGVVRYVGLAGERASGAPGVYGALGAVWSGRGVLTGFGEAALDRALADEDWVALQLADLRERGPRTAKQWAGDAVVRLGLEVSWATRPDRDDARYLERQVVALLRPLGSVW